MKFVKLVVCSLLMSGCAYFGGRSPIAEKVSSCFADGENQATHCKVKRVLEGGKIATTRCIGALNQHAPPSLRGKCAEKICSEGSNTDCQVRGEIAVLGEYAEQVTARLFDTDESSKSPDGNTLASVAPPAEMSLASTASKAEVDSKTSRSKKRSSASAKGPSRKLASMSPAPTAAAAGASEEASVSSDSMQLVLRPVKKSRAPASVADISQGFKKVCVASNESEAPANLRGKCATRKCAKGKCIYQGRREMFDWVSSRGEI